MPDQLTTPYLILIHAFLSITTSTNADGVYVHCKMKTGCTRCDPVPYTSIEERLFRKEFPITCKNAMQEELLNMSQSNAILLEKFENLTAMVKLLNDNNTKLSEKIDRLEAIEFKIENNTKLIEKIDRVYENNSKLSEKIARLNENNTKLTEMLDSLNKNNTKLYERNAELNKELELQAKTNAKQTEKNALLEGIGSKTDYQGKVRLVNGSSFKNGRVEVLYNGTWGTVCDDVWSGTTGKHNADVVCKQLGFRRSTWYEENADGNHHRRYGMGTGKIWLRVVSCTGSENFISDCQHETWGTTYCVHNEDVAVECE